MCVWAHNAWKDSQSMSLYAYHSALPPPHPAPPLCLSSSARKWIFLYSLVYMSKYYICCTNYKNEDIYTILFSFPPSACHRFWWQNIFCGHINHSNAERTNERTQSISVSLYPCGSPNSVTVMFTSSHPPTLPLSLPPSSHTHTNILHSLGRENILHARLPCPLSLDWLA